MSKPTKDDANLMIQLLRWGAEEGVQDAMNWVWSDEFVSDYDAFIAKYPRGSKEYGNGEFFFDYLKKLKQKNN